MRKAIEDGKLKGNETLAANVILRLGTISLEVKFDGDIKLE